jgi:hypothetical protein
MRLLTNLLFKVTVSSMVLTAPAVIEGHAGGVLMDREAESPFATATVIKNYIDHLKIWPVRAYVDKKSTTAILPYVSAPAVSSEKKELSEKADLTGKKELTEKTDLIEKKELTEKKELIAAMPVAGESKEKAAHVEVSSRSMKAAFYKAAELKRVIGESEFLYSSMGLDKEGLSETAFEYAWRGYHNLLKNGTIRKRSFLSIADFSQSSSEKRMYVIDVRHRRLLYRTYVAHGQNSGSEFAETFSNEPESFKSSLGFYVTKATYYGRNGLSLKLDGVDNGYNDQAMKRNIVLHGCAYVGDSYLESFGATGTSLGCPALPAGISTQIIRKVKDGSCFFIYHPTQEYLDHSMVINQ